MNELEIKRTPDVIGAEIRSLTNQARCITLWYGIEIGRRLTEAKELVEHGEWMRFLEQQTDFSRQTANRFMKLYKEYGADQNSLFGAELNCSTLSNLSISNALRLLALPEEEREDFAKENDLEHKSAREVEELIRQKTELEKKLKDKERELAEADEGHALALEEAVSERDISREELNTTAEQLKTARERIRELEDRPTEVAVERDEEAIQTAVASARLEERIEAEKAAEETIDKLTKKHEKALAEEIKKAKAAQAEVDKLRADLKKAQADTDRAPLEAQIKALEVQLTMAAPEVAAFKAAFDRVQWEFNAMVDALQQVKDEQTRAKLHGAVAAMVGNFGAAMEGAYG